MQYRIKVFVSLLFCTLLLLVAACNNNKQHPSGETKQIPQEKQEAKPMDKKSEETTSEKSANQKAVLETNLGKIEIRFFEDKAPKHVKNFKDLVQKEFYDGTTFHRVIPGFMIQGGDPNSKDDDRTNDGFGGPGYTIDAEFNDKPHKRGTLSMARSQDPNSAGSQFFICVADVPHLDGKYTVFGEVITGLDVVDKIVQVPTDKRDNPNEKVLVNKITLAPFNG